MFIFYTVNKLQFNTVDFLYCNTIVGSLYFVCIVVINITLASVKQNHYLAGNFYTIKKYIYFLNKKGIT